MNYFDLHCDTLFEMEKRDLGFYNGGALAVSFENRTVFDKYARIMAIWTKFGISDDEAFEHYKKIVENMNSRLDGRIALCRTYDEMKAAQSGGKIPFFLAVEGATLLGGDIKRLDTLYADGVRFLTLTWKDDGCIGGSWNTESGLSDFGRDVISRCGELGITVDISHASRKMIAETLEIAKETGVRVIATHSNADACCHHGRNLTDGEAKKIAALGGIIGISFTPGHLSESGTADIFDIVRHAKHYLSLGLENALCIGADFDGIVTLPDGIKNERNIVDVCAEFISAGIDRRIVEKIFWENAVNFIKRNM